MNSIYKIFLVLVVLQFVIAVSLSAQQRPGVASPIFGQSMLAGSKAVVIDHTAAIKPHSISTASSASLAGGNRLVAMQNPDGGWGWDLTGPSALNTVSPIAMGLAQAYQQTWNSSLRAGLEKAGLYLLAKTNNFSPSDGYLAAQLDKIFGGTTYTNYVKTNYYDQLAAGTYNRNGEGTPYNTSAYVTAISTERHAGGIGNIAAWDIGMGLVGAAMCGASTADWVTGVEGEINVLNGNAYYDVIGLAGAIYGLSYVHQDFNPTSGQHAAASNINDLAAILTSYQISGGGFTWNSNYVSSGNETNQESAYAILALNQVNRTLYLTDIQGAANSLMTAQLGTGGWSDYIGDPTENNELTGEALWAITAAYPPPVQNTTKGVYYPTIQGAINDATANDVITVAAGTYSEYLTVNKPVTLRGANAGIHPAIGTSPSASVGTRVTETILTSPFYLSPAADHITVDGFKITGSGGRLFDTYSDANYFHLTNCIFIDPTVAGSQGVVQFGGGSHTDMLIDYNIFQDKGDHTLYFGGGPYDRLHVQYNKITGDGDSFFWAASVLVDGVIGYNEFDGTEGGVHGVAFNTINIGLGGNISIDHNWFHDLQYTPFQVGIVGGSVTNNTIEHIYPYDSYGSDAFQLWGGQWGTPISANVTITGNTIHYNDIPGAAYPAHGIRLRGYDTPPGINGATIRIHNNSFLSGGARADAMAIRNQGQPGTMVDAESNWWGHASGPYNLALNPSGTGGVVGDGVDFDPWTGKAVSQAVTSASTGQPLVVTNTNVTMDFTSLPPGTNATVTIQEVPSVPAGLPALPATSGTIAPLYLIFTPTGLTNGTFSCTLTLNVSGISGFSSTTQVMYYSTISNSWVGVTGIYNAGAGTFTFTTDHFTPFVFVNPGNPINLYLTTDNANTSKNIFYPQVGMGSGLTYAVDDWSYATPKCTLYVVPTGTQGIVAANFRILYDATKASVVATTGNLFAGPAFYTSTPGSGQLLVQTSNLDAAINVVPGSNKYLAMLVFTITKPGYNSIGFDDLDFRYYNTGSDAQNSVYVTEHPGSIKFYLGDVSSPLLLTTTGDGVVGYDDLVPFSLAYWTVRGGSPAGYETKYDIGPTGVNGSYFAMPIPDGQIEFEDLVIFSIGYGKSAAGQLPKQSVQPITLATLTPLPQADGTTRVPISVSGAVTDMRALSLSMLYPSTMTFVGVEKAGEFDNDYSFMKSKAEDGKLTVDAAILGLEHKGISNAGTIAYAVFNGTGTVRVEQVRARNSANNPIGVTIQNSGTVPTVYSLSQNYPNPFNPTTTIRYELPKDAQVTIVIYNMLGEEVTTLVNGMQSAGSYTATWNGKDGIGQTVSSGMYIYKMTAGDYVGIKKMVFMK